MKLRRAYYLRKEGLKKQLLLTKITPKLFTQSVQIVLKTYRLKLLFT